MYHGVRGKEGGPFKGSGWERGLRKGEKKKCRELGLLGGRGFSKFLKEQVAASSVLKLSQFYVSTTCGQFDPWVR